MEESIDEIRARIAQDPYCATLGIEVTALEPGYAEAELEITPALTNFHGIPHGGAIHSLADAACAAAANSRGEDAVALEGNISYLDAVEVGTTLRATAEEVHTGGRTAAYEVVVAEADTGTSGDVEGDHGADDGRIATARIRAYRLS